MNVAGRRSSTTHWSLSVAVAAAVVATTVGLSQWNAAGIEFGDPALEQLVREKAEREAGELRRTDVLRITHIDGAGRGITDLDGIAALRRLESLRLPRNGIADVSPLAELPRLVELDLSGNGLADLDGAGFGALADGRIRELRLRSNGITDLAPIGRMTALARLDLRDNHLRDIGGLDSLHRLEHLNLRENRVGDLSPLAGLTGLRYLNVHSNRDAHGFAELGGLHELEELIARDVPVGEAVTVLDGLPQLRRVNLRGSGILSLPPVQDIARRASAAGSAAAALPWVDIRDNPVLRALDADQHGSLVRAAGPPGAVLPALVPPSFSVARGHHAEPFLLELSSVPGAEIHYTLDGSDPDPVANPQRTIRYEAPVLVDERGSEQHPLGLVGLTYRGDPLEPSSELPSATVVTARARLGDAVSERVTHTYFVGTDVFARYGIRLVSLVGDPDGLLGHEQGILVAGQVYDDTVGFWRDLNPTALGHYQPANFHQRGRIRLALGGVEVVDRGDGLVAIPIVDHGVRLSFQYLRNAPQVQVTGTTFYDGIHYLDPSSTPDELVLEAPYVPLEFGPDAELTADWERPVHAELFDGAGSPEVLDVLGLRVHGAASRTGIQKSLRLYARGAYGAPSISVPLFGEDDGPHRRLLLRRTTERSGLDDALGQELMRQLLPAADIQRYAPVALFINGDFFGSYSLRDRYDQWFLSEGYGVRPEDVTIVGGSGSVVHGDDRFGVEFSEIERFVRTEDLTSDAALAHVEKHLDLDNYIAYMINGMFLNYTDWGTGKHRRVWRSTHEMLHIHPSLDGRWRWLPLDLDGTFVRGGPPDQNHVGPIIASGRYMLTYLLANDAFAARFRERFEEALVTTLHPDATVPLLDAMAASISRGLREDHDDLYGAAPGAWEQHVAGMRRFLEERPAHVQRHLEQFFEGREDTD